MPLFAFEFFDPLRRRWVRARYRAHLEDVRQRYDQFRIVGRPIEPSNVGGFMPPTGQVAEPPGSGAKRVKTLSERERAKRWEK